MRTLLIASLFAFQAVTPAQRGMIAVDVRDRDGVIPGATITMTRLGVADPIRFNTNAVGQFGMLLEVGSYNMTVVAPGFKPATSRAEVTANQTFTANIHLQIGSQSEVLTVRPGSGANPTPAEPEAVSPNPRTAPELLDAAKWYLEQRRLAEAEATSGRAFELIRARAAQQAPLPPVAAAPAGQIRPIRAGGAVAPPRKQRHVDPIYPSDPRAAGGGGIVVLEAVIGTDGAVRNTRILQGAPFFDEAALAAVKHWQYTPARLNGVPIAVSMDVSVNFRAR